jgi:lysosomal acid phosphatase
MVIEVCRHGARSPINQRYNVTETYWPRGLGMLTPIGERQHYALGQELRKRYIDQYKLLDPTYNASQLVAYSTIR